jgi:predicted glycosyltransferase
MSGERDQNGNGRAPLINGTSRDTSQARKRRIALYSPGVVGLGHMRRNLLIGQSLAGSAPGAVVLMVAEAWHAATFAMPPGMDCLTLPALRKEADGQCRPRYLGVSLAEVTALRAKVICAGLEAFDPDALIVDFLPRGRLGELEQTLEHLRTGGRTRCVLGLRDVLEDPLWFHDTNEDRIRDYYDAVWIYGDPGVYNLIREYRFSPDVADKMCHTGYLDQRPRLNFADPENLSLLDRLGLPPGRLILCLMGGGWDGAALGEMFAQAELPPDANGIILTGPLMPPEAQLRLRRLAAQRPRLRVLDFVTEPAPLLERCDRVVAMGGYNTICEILSFEKHGLIVPRERPREQFFRAERLRALGLVDVLPPTQVNPDALTEWMARDAPPRPRGRALVDFNGLTRIPHLLEQVLAHSCARSSRAPHAPLEGVVHHVAP